jgi:ADP-ribose pyrophosphatase
VAEQPIVPTEIAKVYEGRIITLQLETITLPKGGTLKAEIVRHPGSVVIIPVTDDGRVLLVRQYRHAIGRWAWELPAGSLKPGEDIAAAARRECHEEVGMIPARLEPLGSFFPTPGYCDEEMHFYRASGLRVPGAGDEAAHQDEDEDIEAGPFALDEIRRMIGAGEIIDLKTVGGLALLESSKRDVKNSK